MRQSQRTKVQVFGGPVTVATNATSATNIDTRGFNMAVVEVVHNAATATNSSAKWTVLQLMHGTTTDATNHTAINGAIGTTHATATTSQFVLPVHNDTTLGGIVRFHVDCRTKERYLRVHKQAAASHHTTSNSITLSNAEDAPDSAADEGVNARVIV